MHPTLLEAPPSTDARPGAEAGGHAGEPSRFRRLMTAGGAADYRLAAGVLAGVLAALFLAVALREPCLQTVYGHDAVVFLNGAWKVRGGLLPSRDYSSALGALNPWLFAAGMWVLGPTAAVLPVCHVAVAVGLGGLAWAVARRRLPAFPALVFALTQTLVAAAAHLLRFDFFAATYDGYYNRQGYALASILLLLLFLPRRPGEDGERGRRADGRRAGAILGLLLFSKVSYFLAGVGLCALAGWSERPFPRVKWGSALAAFGIVCAACLPLIGFDLPGMWRDLRLAAGARGANPEAALTFAHYFEGVTLSWVEIGLLATAQFAASSPVRRGRRAAGGGAPGWAVFAGFVGLCLFIYMTNAHGGTRSENPLLAAWLFVVLGHVLRTGAAAAPPAPASGYAREGLPVLCGVLGVVWVLSFGTSLQSLLWSNSPWPTPWRARAAAGAGRFDAPPLRPLLVSGYGGGVPMPGTYVEKVNDGLRLLRALGGVHRVEAFDYANPFPFALRWPAARGGFWCWQNGYSFSEASHPSAEEAFGDADVVMVPRYPAVPGSFEAMTRLYGPYLKAHYRVRSSSDQWLVLARP